MIKKLLERLSDHLLSFILVSLTLLVIAASFFTYGITTYEAAISPSGSSDPGKRFTVILVVALIGYLLAVTRHELQKLYGVFQILAAAFGVWSLTGMPLSESRLANALALLALAFVMARGFYEEGEKDWKKRDAERKAWKEQIRQWEIDKKQMEEDRQRHKEEHKKETERHRVEIEAAKREWEVVEQKLKAVLSERRPEP